MSKDFKSQDHFRYKKLGKRWRRPVGWQSKLRLKKGGAGRKVSVGYGSFKEGELDEVILVDSINDVIAAKGRPVRIASGVGAKKTLAISQKAKELGSRIVNAKKVKRAGKIQKGIAAKKARKKGGEEKKEKPAIAQEQDKKPGIKSGAGETAEGRKEKSDDTVKQVNENT